MTNQVIEFIKSTYSVEPEFLWIDNPETAAIRNPRNKKWFAVLLGGLSKSKLGINSAGKADVLNLKCDPLLNFSIVDNKRIFRGYHMNKEHWISVLLDGSVPMEELAFLIEMSYNLVDRKSKK